MTELSGFTLSYTDPNSGVVLPTAWAQIRQINYTPEKSCLVVTDIYQNEASKIAGKSPVFMNVVAPVSLGSAAWATYFDTAVMDLALHNIQKQALDYLTETI